VITKGLFVLVAALWNIGLQALINTENSPYLTRKKITLSEGLSHFAKQSKQKNLSLLQQLLSGNKKPEDRPLMREIEENLVIAQIIAEETPALREILEKEPKHFITCLLLCTLDKEPTTQAPLVVRRASKKNFPSTTTLGLAIIATFALCYACIALYDSNTTSVSAAETIDPTQAGFGNCFTALRARVNPPLPN
jgi:hypothetical protein